MRRHFLLLIRMLALILAGEVEYIVGQMLSPLHGVSRNVCVSKHPQTHT
jgi:hypothetical protein